MDSRVSRTNNFE